ncbi:hypothetical protein EJ06DRAFT_511929 [Trichodelitschia bisporula]|uniref:PAC domain-containing protein n=1 Tax=Trichodelitschia bisporula TaxID=703511 RepID=A0A6G1HUX5_9PEZI|nr:hypothetical protein EJ06DRAFT_511929 [Trichodelitschia bisporula]
MAYTLFPPSDAPPSVPRTRSLSRQRSKSPALTSILEATPPRPQAPVEHNPSSAYPAEADNEDASSEPLITDLATRSIPPEYAPLKSATPEPGTRREASRRAGKRPASFACDGDSVSMYGSLGLGQREIHIPTRTSSSRVVSNGTGTSRRRKRQGREFSASSSAPTTPDLRLGSSDDSVRSYSTHTSSVTRSPPLLSKPSIDADRLAPVTEDDPRSFDLVQPASAPVGGGFELEKRVEEMFSAQHLREVFADPGLLLRFTHFLSSGRPGRIPLLIYYLDALKALRALAYANAVSEALEPIPGHAFTDNPPGPTVNGVLEERAEQAFDALVRDDLPAFVGHVFTQIAADAIHKRITGAEPLELADAEGLAEVFCLTDPSRADNPIVYASEEFHKTTQYGVTYSLGRNPRFLQGPRTTPSSITTLQAALAQPTESTHLLLNYRRDGSPFLNLLLLAPLTDSRGQLRYWLGAHVDATPLARSCAGLDGLQRLLSRGGEGGEAGAQNELQDLCEMFNLDELATISRRGGAMHRDLLSPTPNLHTKRSFSGAPPPAHFSPGVGVRSLFPKYLILRPHPSLRILFASPALRTPRLLQTPFLSRIGGSPRVRDELTAALAGGRGVTAKVRWLSAREGEGDGEDGEEGRVRWIHCTPLLGREGVVGAWVVLVVDEESAGGEGRRVSTGWKPAPVVEGRKKVAGLGVIRDRTDEAPFERGMSVGGGSERGEEWGLE